MTENDLASRPKDTPVNPDIQDTEGFTLLMRASQHLSADCEYVNSNSHTLIKHLLDSGVDPEARSPDGMTAFEMAVQCNNWPAIQELLPRCEVKIGDNVSLTGTKYLHELAKQKEICDEKLISFTKSLLAHGLNINEVDSHGHSPLLVAVDNANWNYVVVLLQHGAKVDNQAFLRFIVANHSLIPHANLTDLLDAMQARAMDFNSLHREGSTILFTKEVYSSISSGQDPSGSLFKMLVDRGANPLVPDRDGYSLLRFAIGVDKDYGLNLLKFLVQAGVTTHQPALTEATRSRPRIISSCDQSVHYMWSPTEAAFEVEDVQALKILIESGASNNRELFELSTYLEKNVYMTKVQKKMLAILKQAATQPRCLKSLCRLTVSHALGCGTRREEKVTCLPVPQRLQQYILFDDILSQELQTPEEISHHKRCRRERRMYAQPTVAYFCSLLRSPSEANNGGQ